jgi:hypothetical protein
MVALKGVSKRSSFQFKILYLESSLLLFRRVCVIESKRSKFNEVSTLVGRRLEMTKKYYSILSGVFFIMAVFPIVAGLTNWGNELYVVVLNVSIFLPLILGVLGFIFALFGIKGKVKGSLVLLNIVGVSLSAFLVFIAMYGLQQP